VWSTIAWLQKHLIWSIPLAMLLGFAVGQLVDASPLRLAILPLTFLMVYPMMVTMNLRQLVRRGSGKLLWVTQLINFVVVPAIGYAAGLLFFPDQPFVRLALLLTALLPTSGMTISWTGFARGNMPAAVQMTVVGLLAGSLLAPLYLKGLLGTVIDIPLTSVFMQIVLIVFLPLLLGNLTQRYLIGKLFLSAALLIALAYIVQVQAAAWYVKLTSRILGPPPLKAN